MTLQLLFFSRLMEHGSAKVLGDEIVNITDIACVDIDNSGQDEAVLAYINQEGYLKWIVFSENGWDVMSGP